MLSDGLSKLGDRGDGAGAAVTAHDVQRELLVDIQRRRIGRRNLTGLGQRDRDDLVADRQRDALEDVLEAELEGEVFLGVAVVVDVDLVQRVGIHLEVVGAAVGVLERLVVGDHRHVAAAAVFVAAEHVEVSTVDPGRAGYGRRLAVAGSLGG